MHLDKLLHGLIAISLMAGGTFAVAQEPKPDGLAQLKRFEGSWSGTATGSPGEGTVERSYAWVMRGRFLQEANTSRYAPKAPGKPGEVHEHMSMLSYDKARKLLVLRQFHVESFVNTYRQVSPPGEFPLVFESEAFENLNSSWRARETYAFNGDDEFVETFELAQPDKPYQVYSQNKFKRVGAK